MNDECMTILSNFHCSNKNSSGQVWGFPLLFVWRLHHHMSPYRWLPIFLRTTVMSDCRSFLYICRNWVQQPHSCNPHPFLIAAWTRSLNLSLTLEEKNPSARSPERFSLQTKTKSMGGQSHILILGQRTWIWYEAGNSPIDHRVSPSSVTSFNGPPPARQSHTEKMLNCKFQTSMVDWRHIIEMGEGFWITHKSGRWKPQGKGTNTSLWVMCL